MGRSIKQSVKYLLHLLMVSKEGLDLGYWIYHNIEQQYVTTKHLYMYTQAAATEFHRDRFHVRFVRLQVQSGRLHQAQNTMTTHHFADLTINHLCPPDCLLLLPELNR